MSSETADLTVTTHTRNNPAHYWAFFTAEDGACWQFVDRNRADLKPQAAAPQHPAQSHPRFAHQRKQENNTHLSPTLGNLHTAHP